MPFGEKTSHPSYGLLSFNRTDSNTGKTLFGSSIKHQRTITMRIKTAEKERDLNKNWYYGRDTIVEVEMSPVQFSEAITAMNMGDGTTVTIRRVHGKAIEPCPDDNIRERFVDEFNSSINRVSDKLDELKAIANDLKNQKGGLKVSEKKDLCSKIEMAHQDLKANLPFVLKQFNRQMNKSVLEAKGEIDAFVTNITQRLGIEEFRKQVAGGTLEIDVPEEHPYCSVCGEPQYETPGGMTCNNGHGGAPSMDEVPRCENCEGSRINGGQNVRMRDSGERLCDPCAKELE